MSTRKGQAAVEYLMTYGWALLAIVIVSGIIWSMGLFGGSCSTSSRGFSGTKIMLDDWKVSNTLVHVTIKNAAGKTLNVTGIDFDGNNATVSPTSITSGSNGVVQGSGLSLGVNSGDCYKDKILAITYNIDGGISHSTSGKISGAYE